MTERGALAATQIPGARGEHQDVPYRVLELRIHGVNNTPPTGMLDLPDDAVEKAAGDDLGSFWRPKPAAIEPLRPVDRGYVPPGVTREAYSWGGMARNSFGGTSGWQKAVAVAARVGWTLLLPFGLVNAAYWSRRLDGGPANPGRSGRGAGSLRLVGVLMTLLFTLGAAILAMDVVGVQCYSAPDRECKKLPSQLDFLGHWAVPNRLALLSLLPLLLLVVLWGLSAKTRTTYDNATWASETTPPDDAAPDADATRTGRYGAALTTKEWPILTTPGFWHHHVISSKTAVLHLAAGAALLQLLTSWHGVFGIDADCSTPSKMRHEQCWRRLGDGAGRGWAELVLLLLGIAVMAAIAWLTVRGSADAADVPQEGEEPRRRGVIVVLAAAAALFSVQEGVLIWWHGEVITAPKLVGMSIAMTVVVCLLAGASAAALFWRQRDQPLFATGIALVLSGLLVGCQTHGVAGWVVRGATLAFVAIIFVLARRSDERYETKYESWRGCGPGICLLLATLISMMLLTASIVGVADVLNGSNSAASLAGGIDAKPVTSCPYSCDVEKGGARLVLPQSIVWFGAGLLVFVLLLLIVLIGVAFGVWRASGRPGGGKIIDPGPVLSASPADVARAASARKFAQVAHRGEAFLGLVAILGSLGLLASLLVGLDWTGSDDPAGWRAVASRAVAPGTWVSAALGALFVAFAAGGSLIGNKRPLGLLWDLICFLPRAGHPLGPPCYAERAVPEVVTRCDRYLSERRDGEVHGDRIVLSAHSLGSVIAVASIFAMRADPTRAGQVDRICLLTYGSQLRAYFGRIFPELFGPDVLGNHPVRAAGLVDPNPVAEAEPRETNPADERSLASLLDATSDRTRWCSLWRRTDYLGFPVYDGLPNVNFVDRGAQEIDRTAYILSVLSHSDYPRTAAYAEALDYLVTGRRPPA